MQGGATCGGNQGVFQCTVSELCLQLQSHGQVTRIHGGKRAIIRERCFSLLQKQKKFLNKIIALYRRTPLIRNLFFAHNLDKNRTQSVEAIA